MIKKIYFNISYHCSFLHLWRTWRQTNSITLNELIFHISERFPFNRAPYHIKTSLRLKGSLSYSPLFTFIKELMHNEVWGYTEI